MGSRVAFRIALLLTAFAPAVRGEFVYFQVAELPGRETHHDSFVVPLSDIQAIAHARDVITRGPEQAGATIIFADIAKGSDGINRNLLADDKPLWNWHVTKFNDFGDIGIELLDGWPGFIESDVDGWIKNSNGQIGLWGYTVVSELHDVQEPAPQPIPLPAMLPAGAVMLGTVICGARRAFKS